jgi:signal transduction histidine kinase/ActR/RegA family two-component response regulator
MIAFFAIIGLLVVLSFNAAAESMRALRETERRFRVALEGGDITVWTCDADRRYTWIYNAAPQIDAASLIGRRLGEANPADRYPLFAEAVERVWRSGRGERVPVTWTHDGIDRHYLVTLEPTRDAIGRVNGLVGASVDVTSLHAAQRETERARNELQQAAEALKEANRRKDTFLATLAHELRNPMAAICYAVPMLRADAPAGALEQARGAIERQAQQMTRLLDGLLDVSRITRDVIELRLEALDLRQIVQEALETARPQIEGARHQLVVSMPPQAIWVRGDPARLLQIVGNLLSNAARYTPPGGQVEVELEPDGELARLRIRDTGVGLSAEMLPKVFELFAQVHREVKASSGGLGIGLAVSKRLTELHGGTLEAQSTGLGLGAQFTIRLPRAPAPDNAHSHSHSGEKVVTLFRDGPQVLVVDDNRDAADNLALLLRTRGLQVHVAYDGSQALALAERARPAIVVLDIGLPDMSGLQVARALRRAPWAAQLTLIAVTGWGQADDRQATHEAGVDLHLVKPVAPEQLLEVIDSAARSQSRRKDA